MTVKTINGKAVINLSPMAIEMDSWITSCGLEQNEIDTLHMNDAFPALTSFIHFLQLIAGNTIFLKKSTDRLVYHVKTDEDLSDFLNNYYHERSDCMYKIVGCIEAYQEKKQNVVKKLSLDEFIRYFAKNPIMTLKLFFHQSAFQAWEIELMNEKLQNGKLTPLAIFKASEISPWYDTLSKIIRADWSKQSFENVAI